MLTIRKITAYLGPSFNTAGCSVSCNSGGGDNTECVGCADEDGNQDDIGGAIISVFGSKRAVSGDQQSVHADRVGVYDTDIKAHRLFNIKSGVPAHVYNELISAFHNGTKVSDLSDAVMAYELK